MLVDSPTGIRRVWFVLVAGLGLATAAMVTALTVDRSAPAAPHYQYLREALVAGTVAIALGALIVYRRPGHSIGLVLLGSGLVDAAQAFLGEWAVAARIFDLGSGTTAAWAANLVRQPNFLLTFALVFLLYPTGKPLERWGRVCLMFAIGAASLWTLTLAFQPVPLEDFPDVESPFGWGALAPALPLLGLAQVVVAVAGVVGGLVSIGGRFRRAQGVERAQIKWFYYAAVLAVVVLVGANIALPVAMEGQLGSVLWLAAPMSILVAMVVAIGRYRLFEIDRLVTRTVTYGLVASLLAVAYAGVVFLLRALLPVQGQLAVAGSTLVVAALFNPLRRKLQVIIESRFNRNRYDAANTIEAFSKTLSGSVDLAPLEGELSRLVGQTMQPRLVAVWLREET